MKRAAFTQQFGIERPIVLGPFGGMSSVSLTAAVSECGGLGSFGLTGYSAERITTTVRELREATARPFAVNLWIPTGDEVEPADVDIRAALEAARPLFAEVGVPVPEVPARFATPFEEQIEAVIAAAPPVVSFVFGAPDELLAERLRAAGIQIIGTATTVDEAILLDNAGVDAIVASGMEAGGHKVSFLAPAEQSLVGTFSLIPQVVDAVRAPVIAAGGVADRRGVAAALALGAAGVQVGTAFLRTRESAASEAHRDAISSAGASDTILTRVMSGRLARGIPNRATRLLEEADAVAPFPAQNWLTGVFRQEANRSGNGELQSLWAGQSAGLSRGETAAEVFAQLAAGL